MRITPFENRNWPGEWCKRCDRRIVIGFVVDDAVWMEVVEDPDTCWCPTCFDEEAQKKRVPYSFDSLWDCPWSVWESEEAT